jgi:SAM-dependent MidA family methyltransferase
VTLRQKIEQEIREHGPIPFSRYMELCLYDPELGYYSRAAEKFGKAGDFYTSSDVHAVFGRLLARQFEEMWRALGSPAQIEVLELGPGRGLFAQDVLDWSQKKFPDFYQAMHYTLVETSPSLRQKLENNFRDRIATARVGVLPQNEDSYVDVRYVHTSSTTGEDARRSIDTFGGMPVSLQETLRKVPRARQQSERQRLHEPRELHEREQLHDRQGHGFSRAEKSDKMERALAPEVPIIVFANEFFDALPVEVLSEYGSLRISTRDGRFVEEWCAPSKDELEFLDRYGVHPEGVPRTEVPLLSQTIMARIAATIERGFLIAIDYGYTREQQLAGRHLDTVMTYRRHSATPDPYQAPGEQDITAHVNFTALAAAAGHAGMQTHKLRMQSQFLMGVGEATQFADVFEDCRLPQERAKVALQLKHLVTPEGMGETFQVMVASKGVDAKVLEKLSGLSFGV